MAIDARHFLEVTQPALARGNATELARAVNARWKQCQLCELLEHPQADVRRVAAITLGLIGGRGVIDCLAQALHDTDRQVNDMAEHGLWSIWFRLCSDAAAEPFQAGLDHIEAERYQPAIEAFDRAQQLDPDFAEACNQSALARFLLGRVEEAIDDYQRAIDRMPCHFAAMAGLGHCYTHLERLEEALACYRKTLEIHPRMAGVQHAVDRIRASAGVSDEPNSLLAGSRLSDSPWADRFNRPT